MNMGSTFDMQQDIRTKSKHEIIDYTDTMLYKQEKYHVKSVVCHYNPTSGPNISFIIFLSLPL